MKKNEFYYNNNFRPVSAVNKLSKIKSKIKTNKSKKI